MKINWGVFRVFFFFLLAFVGLRGFSEGTRQFWPNTHPNDSCRILICKGTISGQPRDSFAVYGTTSNYRLYVHIEDFNNEKICFGLGQCSGTVTRIRVHRPDDAFGNPNPVFLYSNTLPTSGNQGYINNYTEAINGPTIINAAGYEAIELTPDQNGDYYFSFEVNNNSSRTFRFFDLSVINMTTIEEIPGRVYSRCWQFSNPGGGFGGYPVFWGQLYIYSNDGIVTRLDPNGMEGRDFSISSNESGCFKVDATHNAQQARRSQDLLRNYPQFKIFLNNPDPSIYPDGVIGQLVPGTVVATPNCNGSIDFTFETTPLNALGTVEITLELSAIVPQPTPAYQDRVLIVNNVPGGVFTVNWDGKDANGVQVASGSTFPFTLRYTKGLTHLPLWDVENNENGFKVILVRPNPTPPLPDPAFYWDDQLLQTNPPASMINVTPPGCTNVNGCHGWGSSAWPNPYNQSDWGDQNTVNTWWYLVSNSTTPVSVTFIRSPGALTGATGPTDVCQGQNNVTFSVTADQYSTSYRWIFPWGTQTTVNPTITVNIPIGATPGLTAVSVNGVNADCGNGPVLNIPFTVHALPTGNVNGPISVCINSTQTYSTVGSMLNYTWTVTGGTLNSGQGTESISVTWNTVGTGNLTITYTDPYGCGVATPGNLDVTVNPLPVPIIGGPLQVCVNATGNFTTALGKTGYTWSVSGGGTIQSGQGTESIVATWNSTGAKIVSLVYTDENGCMNMTPSNYNVTILPSPTPIVTGDPAVCINLTGIYHTEAAMTSYIWTTTPGGTIQSGQGTKDIVVQWTAAGSHRVTVEYTNGSGCPTAVPTVFPVTVNPLPVADIAGSATVCQDFPTTYSYQTTTIEPGATYAWQITSGNGTITPSTGDNPININWNAPGGASLKVTSTSAAGCVDSRTVAITVNQKPDVSMVMCFDNVTTRSAKRFLLKGGKPPYTAPAPSVQGEYLTTPATPALVFDAPTGNYYFDPSLIPGNNTTTINLSYRYTNQYGCPNTTTTVPIVVQGANPACGATMTDPRDGKVYATSLIAGRCWMAQNLNFPSGQAPINSGSPQTDNCMVEKYCPPNDATCATAGGAYYQWDELIQFGNTEGPLYQGLCPPAWHIPTETEWQSLIDNADPAFSAPAANAMAGSWLKDSYKSFDALMNGVSYLNSTWAYTASPLMATMFWTSTPDGNNSAIARGLNDPYNPSISKYSASRANAFPVRCVKD